jgi:hypothetical protein
VGKIAGTDRSLTSSGIRAVVVQHKRLGIVASDQLLVAGQAGLHKQEMGKKKAAGQLADGEGNLTLLRVPLITTL